MKQEFDANDARAGILQTAFILQNNVGPTCSFCWIFLMAFVKVIWANWKMVKSSLFSFVDLYQVANVDTFTFYDDLWLADCKLVALRQSEDQHLGPCLRTDFQVGYCICLIWLYLYVILDQLDNKLVGNKSSPSG